LTTKNKESTWQLERDPAVAVDLTRESLDLETDSVVRMPYTGPEVHSSTLLECRKKISVNHTVTDKIYTTG